jgi:hypothetical protein
MTVCYVCDKNLRAINADVKYTDWKRKYHCKCNKLFNDFVSFTLQHPTQKLYTNVQHYYKVNK